MATGAEPPLGDQLVEARARIVAQLDRMALRSIPGGGFRMRPPDYSGLIAELEGELREIDALLGTGDSPDA